MLILLTLILYKFNLSRGDFNSKLAIKGVQILLRVETIILFKPLMSLQKE